jgi:hypothetical protein
MSSSSLPTPPKTSSDDWMIGMTPKPLPKTFHESSRKFSAESQRRTRQGWEWVWVFESNDVKRESSEPLQVSKEKLTPKRLRRSLPVRKTDRIYRFDSLDESYSSHWEYGAKSSTLDVASPDGKTILRPSTLFRGGKSGSGASQSCSKFLRVFQYMSPTYPHFRSPTGEPEGLCCKTKRGIGVRLMGKYKEVGRRITGSTLLVSQYNRMNPSFSYALGRGYLQRPRKHSKALQKP